MKLVLLFLFLFFPLIAMQKDEASLEIKRPPFPTLLQLCVTSISRMSLEQLRAYHKTLPDIPMDINPLLAQAIVNETTPFITKYIKLKRRGLDTEILGWPNTIQRNGNLLTVQGAYLADAFDIRENISKCFDIKKKERISTTTTIATDPSDDLFHVKKEGKKLVVFQAISGKELLSIKPRNTSLFLYCDKNYLHTLELVTFTHIMYYKLKPLTQALDSLKKISDYKQALLLKAICHANKHQHFYDLRNSKDQQLYNLFPEEVKDLIKKYLRTRKWRCSLS